MASTMDSMFDSTLSFNSSLKMNTASVVTMKNMFFNSKFDQELDMDTRNVKDILGCSIFHISIVHSS